MLCQTPRIGMYSTQVHDIVCVCVCVCLQMYVFVHVHVRICVFVRMVKIVFSGSLASNTRFSLHRPASLLSVVAADQRPHYVRVEI